MALSFVPQSKRLRLRLSKVENERRKDIQFVDSLEKWSENKFKNAFKLFVRRSKTDDILKSVRELYKQGRVFDVSKILDDKIVEFAEVYDEVYIKVGKAEIKDLSEKLRKQITKVIIDPEFEVVFNPGSKLAVEALKKMKLDLIREITKAQREAIRAALEEALADGLGPVAAGRAFRDSIGLTAYQMSSVNRYRTLLENGDPAALNRVLRDRRFDPTVQRAIAGEIILTPQQIDHMTSRYHSRFIDMRAETIGRTETLRAVNNSRSVALEQFVDETGIEASRVERTWVARLDPRVRDTHRAMNGQIRGKDEPFVSPSGAKLKHPGDRTAPPDEVINCRCVLTIRIKDPEEVAQETDIALPADPLPELNTGADIDAIGASTLTQNVSLYGTTIEPLVAKNAGKLTKTFYNQATQIILDAQNIKVMLAKPELDAFDKAFILTWNAKAKKLFADIQKSAKDGKPKGIADAPSQKIGSAEIVNSPKGEIAVPKKDTGPPKASGLKDEDFEEFPEIDFFDKRPQPVLNDMFFEMGMDKALSSKEIKTVKSYTKHLSGDINKVVSKSLRSSVSMDRRALPQEDKLLGFDIEDVKRLDGIFNKGLSMSRSVKVFRGVGRNDFDEFIKPLLKKGETVIIDKGYMSTSINRVIAKVFAGGGRVIEIHIPKGSKSALPIQKISAFTKENEILIHRESQFLVKEFTDDKVVLELVE